MSYGGSPQQRGFPATFRTKLGIDDDGTRHVIVESLVGDNWQQVARLGSVETDKFLTNESMGGYRYKHHEHKQASGVATEYFMLRMSTGGDGTSIVAGNYDAPVNYLASGEGGWQLVYKTDVDTTDDTGDKGGSFVEVTEFITTATLKESTLLETISVDCSEAVSDVAFNTTVLSNDLSTIHSKHQTQLTFDSLQDDEQRFKLELTAGTNVLPFPQGYPLGEGETCTLRYQFNRPIKLRTNSDGTVWGTVHGKKLVLEQTATQEWASGVFGAMEVDVADIDTLDTSDLTLGKEINVTNAVTLPIPPVPEYTFYTPEQAKAVHDIEISGFDSDITVSNDTYVPIFKDSFGRVLLSFNGFLNTYKLTCIDSGDAYFDVLLEEVSGTHNAHFAAGKADISVEWDVTGGVSTATISVNGVSRSNFLNTNSNTQVPKYAVICSKGFRDLTVNRGDVQILDANTGSEDLTDTKVIVGKMHFNGAELEDISPPKDVFFGGSESGDRRWLQNLTVRHSEVVYVAPQLVEAYQLLVSSYAKKLRVRYTSDEQVTNPVSLLFPSGDIFELSHAGDDVEFSKIGSVWYYINMRNNEKGEF